MAKKPPLVIKAPDRPANATVLQPIYELSTTAIDATPTSAELPPEAQTLSEKLRELAVRFIGTRRRIGEALIEACRYMSEARAIAAEGEWYLFLQVTGTSPDSAETLLNIHYRATQYATFAEKIRSGWLNQTVAGELAKPSTPPELLQQILERDKPPRVADIKQARQATRVPREKNHHPVDNPNYSGWEPSLHLGSGASDGVQAAHQHPQAILVTTLSEAAAMLETIAHQAAHLPRNEQTMRALQRIEHALAAIRSTVTS